MIVHAAKLETKTSDPPGQSARARGTSASPIDRKELAGNAKVLTLDTVDCIPSLFLAYVSGF